MQVEAVLVDEVVRHEGGGEAIALMSSGTTERATVVFQSAWSRVRENTTLGMSRQMRANSRIGALLDGSWSAVGQKPAISS